MKVYCVFQFKYGEKHLAKIFSNVKSAIEYVDSRFPNTFDDLTIEEWEVQS